MNKVHSILIIAVVAVVTAGIRFLPFLIFNGRKPIPNFVSYLSKVLPCAVMGMLIIYCLRNVKLYEKPFGLPELISCLIVVGLHIWRKNTLLSICVGTVVYMVLIQVVF